MVIVFLMALTVFIAFFVLPVSLFAFGINRTKTPRLRKAAVIGWMAVAASGLLLWHIGQRRVIARAFAPDGTELIVLQDCNWNPEDFSTSVYYRRPGNARWGWFYYDHQDDYWGQGRTEVDPQVKRISVYRAGRVTITFDWETERYRMMRPGRREVRESVGAEEWVSPPL